MSKSRWYIIHAYSGFEKKVAEAIKEQAQQQGLEALVDEVIVPTEEVIEVRKGKKVKAEKKFFPGYVLIKMVLTDDTYHLANGHAKVTGFLGPQGRPSPISDAEAPASSTRLRKVLSARVRTLCLRSVRKYA